MMRSVDKPAQYLSLHLTTWYPASNLLWRSVFWVGSWSIICRCTYAAFANNEWPDDAKYGNISYTDCRCRFQFPVLSALMNFLKISTISIYCNHSSAVLDVICSLCSDTVCCNFWNICEEHTSSTDNLSDIDSPYSSRAILSSLISLSGSMGFWWVTSWKTSFSSIPAASWSRLLVGTGTFYASATRVVFSAAIKSCYVVIHIIGYELNGVVLRVSGCVWTMCYSCTPFISLYLSIRTWKSMFTQCINQEAWCEVMMHLYPQAELVRNEDSSRAHSLHEWLSNGRKFQITIFTWKHCIHKRINVSRYHHHTAKL